MEYLKEYIFNLPCQYNNIIDEYIHLEMLCRDTIFYDLQRQFEAISSHTSSSKISDYYYEKIEYIKSYFDTEYDLAKYFNIDNESETVIER